MWALGWVLREGRWQIMVGGVVSAAVQRPNEPPHVTLLPWSPAPAGIGASTCFQGFALSLSPRPTHGERSSDDPTAALQPVTFCPCDLEGKNPRTRWLSLWSVSSLKIIQRGQETLQTLIWWWPCSELALPPLRELCQLRKGHAMCIAT